MEDNTLNVSGYVQGDKPNEIILPAKPEPLALNLEETAVIVVDMQNAYATKNGYLDKAGFDISSTGPVIANTAKVLSVARQAGMPVIYFQNGWDPEYIEAGGPGSPNWYKSNALKTMRKQPELMGSLLAKGTWDYRYSGFTNTNLDSILRNRGIRTLIFTGIATNVCVESTLRDGFFLEYFGVALEDATHQAGSDDIQNASLYNIATFFGWVSDVDTFCTEVEKNIS